MTARSSRIPSEPSAFVHSSVPSMKAFINLHEEAGYTRTGHNTPKTHLWRNRASPPSRSRSSINMLLITMIAWQNNMLPAFLIFAAALTSRQRWPARY